MEKEKQPSPETLKPTPTKIGEQVLKSDMLAEYLEKGGTDASYIAYLQAPEWDDPRR